MELAERFKDCVFLDVVGDESPATRKMMVGTRAHVHDMRTHTHTRPLVRARAGSTCIHAGARSHMAGAMRVQVNMKVKSTPTFILHRGGEVVHSFSGIKNNTLRDSILERLKPEETGRDWVEKNPQNSESDDE